MDFEDRVKPPRSFVSGPAKIRIIENGPARVALEVERVTENSTFTQQIRLASGSAGDRVEIFNKIDWRAFQASLRAGFSLLAENPEASFDDKVGVVRRGNNNPKCFEMNQQQWMDLTDKAGGYGVSILNDSKFACDKPDDHTIRLTMIYTPGTRGGTPDQGTQDQGRHEILYAIVGHAGDWAKGRAPWQAARLNQPLRAFLPTAHPGALGKAFSLLSLNSDQVQVMAVKNAEDSDETVIRVKELTGKPASGLVLRFPAAITAAREIDAQERPIGDASVKNGALAFDMKGFGLKAFALKLAPPPASVPAVTSAPVSIAYDTAVASSRAKRAAGSMDASGGAYPAEMFPSKLTSQGVEFQLGSAADGAKNALSAHGQSLPLPAGDFTRVHLLVAADGDAKGQIRIGDSSKPLDVPNWTGYVGQWDNRVWDPSDGGDEHKKPPVGLEPGFTKRTPVAWFATHHSNPDGDAFYEYSYLFQVSYDLPPGARSITLPDNPKIRVFAVSAGHEPSAAPAAAPLYDTLADHQRGGVPTIPQDGAAFADSTEVTLLPPLYHGPRELHYTVDGSEPAASSPVYEGPFFVSDTVKVAVREIDSQGNAGVVTRGVINVRDTTPPRLLDASIEGKKSVLDLTFSEPLAPASVANLGNYRVQPAAAISNADISPDGRKVALTFTAPLAPGADYTLTVNGLKDRSPAGNVIAKTSRPFNAQNIVYTLASAELPAGAVKADVQGLPVLKKDPWTMNLFVKASAKQQGRAILAGFGSVTDTPGSGSISRYLAVYSDDIRFWFVGELDTHSPLDLGRWQMLTATYNGDTLALYKDGQRIGEKRVAFTADAEPVVNVAPPDPWEQTALFHGSVQQFTIRRGALNTEAVKKLFEQTKPR